MKRGDAALIILAGGAVLMLGCAALTLAFEEDANRVVDAITLAAVAIVAALVVAAILAAIGVPLILLYRMLIRARQIHPGPTGLYPLVPPRQWENPNPEAPQLVAAAAGAYARFGQRPTANATRAMITASRAPAISSTSSIPSSTVPTAITPWPGDIDLHQRPHYGFFGATGSGKSTAIYALTQRISRHYPDAAFIPLETGGATWGDQAAAWSDAGLAAGLREVEAEMERREHALRAANVADAAQLPTVPPRLIVIVEEAESAFDNLIKLGRQDARLAAIAIRNISRRGRKTHIHLITATQYGRADSFDTSIRSNLDLYVLRSQPGLAEMLRISKQIDITQLPAGVAWSVARSALIQFPQLPRPTLPLSGLYRENGTEPPTEPVQDAIWRPLEPVQPVQQPAAVPPLPPDPYSGSVSPQLAHHIHAIWAGPGARQIKTTQRILFPDIDSVGGHWWYWIDAIVRQIENRPPRPNSPITLTIK